MESGSPIRDGDNREFFKDAPVSKYDDLSVSQKVICDKIIGSLDSTRRSKNKSSVVLGVEGAWGSGKLQSLTGFKDKLNQGHPKWKVSEYNAGSVGSAEKLQLDILMAISSKFGFILKCLLKVYNSQVSSETKNRIYKLFIQILSLLVISSGSIYTTMRSNLYYSVDTCAYTITDTNRFSYLHFIFGSAW
ncbi:MAG: KAP family NTPase [Candidatus Ancillula trichonymphae]|jgi:hypothetical protein|nr:KAP family NTPase [Candidatus Ancillula trichonymphae]